MIDHVGVSVSDRETSERFYRTVLPTLGIEPTSVTPEFMEWDTFALAQATAERPVTRRLHIGFAAPSREHVDEFWRVGTGAGYRDDGAPGPRPEYSPDYYGAFLLDPDGNSAEAVIHGETHNRRVVDHLWIRVADVAASKRFFETIAPYARIALRHDAPERASFAAERSSFSLVAGDPTEHLHLAFDAPDNASVDGFHRAATAAGYRDNGGPGERPEYHSGYYAAFVLDPDGNNIEVVNHNP